MLLQVGTYSPRQRPPVLPTQVGIHALRGAGHGKGVDGGPPGLRRGHAAPAMTGRVPKACAANSYNQRHISQ
jgi:hypothetical protein